MAQILIVEDNLEMLEILKRALEAKGYDVEVAAGGQAGLDAYNKKQFDVVVTDIVMPGVDGLEFVKAVRNIDKTTKIIAISGGGADMEASYALNVADIYGADVELYKPFSLEEFMERVAGLLAE
ncbi:MAG: response regulator [Alphaproteobacteria bacterium]|nr:response regulator [Alphaproteobacteria bacterium]